MNKTETLAYQWLQEQGYSPLDIDFRRSDSPDFITADGKGWEVKLVRGWQVVFTGTQVARLRAHPDVTLLLWVDGQLQNAKPFEELEVPGRWGKYNFHVLASTNIKVPDDVHKRLVEYADGRPLGMAIIRLLDGISSVQHAVEQVRAGETLTKEEVFPDPPLDATLVGNAQVEEYTGKDGEPRSRGTLSVPAEGFRQRAQEILDAQRGKADWKPICTCGPGEKATGRHNKKCPAKGG